MSVFVSNIGYTKVGDHWRKSIAELAYEACKSVAIDGPKTEAVVVSNAFAELTSSQANLGPLIADALGFEGVEAFKVESSGASGAAALHVAYEMIRSGQVGSALVVGVEKMRDLEPAKLVLAQSLAESADYTQFFGVSFASVNALLARMYLKEYDVSREQLSSIPVIAHKNSSSSAHAQFKKKFTAEEVSRSELISDPLRVLDCAPVGDGAAAVLLTDEKGVRESKSKPKVEILASETSSSKINFFEKEDMFRFSSTETAAKRALAKAALQISDIDFLEIHDSYSILAALVIEALGLSKRGEACSEAEAGKFDLIGTFPISTYGGMKARGYPIGAAGVYQFCEAYMQLTGAAGQNQVPSAKYGLVHSMSGIDSSAYVHVLSGRSSN